MKAMLGSVAAVVLIAAGLVTAAYSTTQLSVQTTLFDRNTIQIDAHSYLGFDMAVNLDGKYQPMVKGGVGSVGCCVDFYLVSDANWNSWSTNPTLRDTLSTEHLNSTAVSSQSIQGEFSFVPSSQGYSVVFVNDEYPNASHVEDAHAAITLQYVPLESIYALVAGLAVMGVGSGVLIMTARRGHR